MYNFFKSILGIPPDDQQGSRSDTDLPGDLMNDIWRNDEGHREQDNFSETSEGNMGRFGFPIFSDPVDIHKYFEGIINEMHRKFGIFGFTSGPSITWEDGSDPFSSITVNEDGNRSTRNLRDSYLKTPGYLTERNSQNEDVDLDGQVKADDLEKYLRNKPGTSNEGNSVFQYGTPNVYSKSVYIRTIRHPDGSVETIKKVRDHTGNEETTITKDVKDPSQNPPNDSLIPSNDVPGVSILKKFFPF